MNQLQTPSAPKVPPRRLPVVVTYVMREQRDSMDAAVKDIRDLCNDWNLMFETRLYDSLKFRVDRDEVLRLPALHIAVNGRWSRTFYPNTRPLQHIEEVVNEYLRAIEKKAERKGRFGRRLRGLVARVKGWFHRETALQRNEREEKARRASVTTSVGDQAEGERRFAQHRRSSVMADWE